MTIDLKVRPRPAPSAEPLAAFPFPITAELHVSEVGAAPSYSEVDIGDSAGAVASDFDLRTIAIVSSIVLFKLILLGLLIYSL